MNMNMRNYWKKNTGFILLFIFFVLASEGITLTIASLSGNLVDAATGGNIDSLKTLFVLILFLSVAMPICFYAYTLFIQFFRAKIQAAMRRDLFHNVLEHPYRSYLKHKEGIYLSTYTNQIDSLENSYFRAIFGILQILASCIFGLIFLFRIHPPFVLYSIIGVLPALVIPECFKPLINRMQKEKITKVTRNIATLNEYLAGMDTIFLFQRQKIFLHLFERETDDIGDISAKIPPLMVLTTNLSYLLLQLYNIVIILLSTVEIAKGSITIGAYVASIHIMADFTGGLSFTGHYLQQFSISKQTLRHIFELTAEDAPAEENALTAEKTRNESLEEMKRSAKKIPVISVDSVREIAYEDISFSYDDTKKILDHVHFRFREKGIYQIIGASGSGKSTLMNLLCGYLEARSGETEINGHPVRSIENLNNLFTIMRQEAIFFEGSLRDNITMFEDVPDPIILSGLSRLGLSRLGEKLDETEFNLSGGEQRRIMLLRALIRNTDILILDEPLANLDRESISLVEKELLEIKDKFLFIITHEPLRIPVIRTIDLSTSQQQ